MNKSPLIAADALQALLNERSAAVLVCDCRFDLANPRAGAQSFEQGHIPGASYVNLDHVLSSPKTGTNGRHPLPSREDFVRSMAQMGVNPDTMVIAYDANDSMYAARLWWMLRWIGHANAAVLDGGLKAWTQAGHPVSTARPMAREAGNVQLRPSLVTTVDYAQVRDNVKLEGRLVLDARSADRFRGENETIDPVGGHIPGARNWFFKNNLTASGQFKTADELRDSFDAITQGREAAAIISQCGSGVTACHNLLAMEVAGLTGAALYPGSWSEWCTQPDAPIARDAQ